MIVLIKKKIAKVTTNKLKKLISYWEPKMYTYINWILIDIYYLNLLELTKTLKIKF